MKSGTVIVGVLAGVAAGALVGVLFAPEKGSRTRRRILTKGEDYADDVKEKFDDFLDSISEKYENLRHDAKALVCRDKTKHDNVNTEVKNISA